MSKVALVAGALLLVTRRVKPQRVYAEIDWSLLVLVIGLFIVVRGVEKTSLSADLFAIASGLRLERPGVISAFAAGLANIVSNEPAVLVFRPFIPHLPDARYAWLTLAMSSTCTNRQFTNNAALGLRMFRPRRPPALSPSASGAPAAYL